MYAPRHLFRAVPLAALLALATVLPTPARAAFTPAEFNQQLQVIKETRKGNAAISAVAALLRRATLASPNNLVAFNRLANNALKTLLKPNLRGKADVALIKAMGLVFFRGRIPYDPTNPKFQTALRTLVATLPPTQRTDAVLVQIFTGLKQLNAIKGGSVQDLQFLADLVYSAAGLPPPTVS
jgi:hypothetical protein